MDHAKARPVDSSVSEREPSSVQRWQKLDCVRGLAILLVLGAHLTPYSEKGFLANVTFAWYRGGWIGVDLFFVLSGFLVGGLLFREYRAFGNVDIKRFLIRRGFKIYPLFWIYLCTAIILRLRVTTDWPVVALSEFFFVQNYGPRFYNHTWSLAVEEHFYIALATALWLLIRFGKPDHKLRMIRWLGCAICVFCLSLRLTTPGGYIDNLRLFPTHLRVDSLMAGAVLGSWFWFYRSELEMFVKKWRHVLVAVGVGLLTPAFFFDLQTTPFIYTVGFSTNYLGAACLVAVAAISPDTPALWARTTAWIGKYSFAIYLWHFPIERILNRTLLAHGWWAVYAISYLTGAILIGGFLSRLLERQILAFRDRHFPSRSPKSAQLARERR